MEVSQARFIVPPPQTIVEIAMADGAVWTCDSVLPPDTAERAALAAWMEGGGQIAPFVAPALEVVHYQAAIDAHVEAVAAQKGYSSAASCAGYAASTVPAWAAQAAAFIAWRDQVWLEVFEALAAVQGGAPAPTIEALIAALPMIGWPE